MLLDNSVVYSMLQLARYQDVIRAKIACDSRGVKVDYATINQYGAIEGWSRLVRNRKHLPALSDRIFFPSPAGPVN